MSTNDVKWGTAAKDGAWRIVDGMAVHRNSGRVLTMAQFLYFCHPRMRTRDREIMPEHDAGAAVRERTLP